MNIQVLVLGVLCCVSTLAFAATEAGADSIQTRLELLWQLEAPQGFSWAGSNKPRRRTARAEKWASLDEELKLRLALIASLMNTHRAHQAKGPFCAYSLKGLEAILGDEPVSGIWLLNAAPKADRTAFWRLMIKTLLEGGAATVLSRLEGMPVDTKAMVTVRDDYLDSKKSAESAACLESDEWVMLDGPDGSDCLPPGWHACA